MDRSLIIADPDSAEVFMLLDCPVRVVHTPDEAVDIFIQSIQEDYSIILITEQEAAMIQRQIADAQQGTHTIVVVLPGMGSSQDTGMRELKALRKSVTGI